MSLQYWMKTALTSSILRGIDESIWNSANVEQIFIVILAKIFQTFILSNKKLWDFTKFNEISWELTKFQNSKLQFKMNGER